MRTLLIALAIILIALGAYLVLANNDPEQVAAEPTTFEECAALYPVMESFPRQCRTPGGALFVEEVDQPPAQSATPGIPNLITVTSPTSGQQISSPLTITGEARGTWYFEASFPLELRDASGAVIAQHYAEAQADWMTENFVPFRSTLSFPAQPAGSQGTLILRKDNPSGLPENDNSVSIPVVF